MSKDRFELVSPFQPTGDQPEAIDALVKSPSGRRTWRPIRITWTT